jgi:hypothetical protein
VLNFDIRTAKIALQDDRELHGQFSGVYTTTSAFSNSYMYHNLGEPSNYSVFLLLPKLQRMLVEPFAGRMD